MSARESGFTLIETLVALGVTATLATSGTVMMLQTLQASRAVDTRMDEVRTLEAANGLFRADLGEVTRRASAPPDDLSPPSAFSARPAKTQATSSVSSAPAGATAARTVIAATCNASPTVSRMATWSAPPGCDPIPPPPRRLSNASC